MGHKGHWGEYSGNAKWSKDHAHTKVTKENYKASERDDAAHIDYLKRDVDYDNKHGHSDEKMTADEKHISKLAGDMKYDKEHHGSPAHQKAPTTSEENKKMAMTMKKNLKCMEGYVMNSKGKCVPTKKA
jgi:midasin (ATPase involved in ribosome maturation)